MSNATALALDHLQQAKNMCGESFVERKIDKAIAALEQEQAEPDNGPWRYRMNLKDPTGPIYRYFVESDDFNHDVRLYVDGDFADSDQRREYGEAIAARLNAAPQPQSPTASTALVTEADLPELPKACYPVGTGETLVGYSVSQMRSYALACIRALAAPARQEQEIRKIVLDWAQGVTTAETAIQKVDRSLSTEPGKKP